MAEDLSGLIKQIEKNMSGTAVVSKLSDIEAPFETRLPTGIMSMDYHLKGGFPAGSMHQIFGPDGSGKDYLTNLIMAQQQKQFGDDTNLAWMSFGYRPDVPFMEMAGLDPDLGNVVHIDITAKKEAMENPAETMLSTMLEVIASNKFKVVIINELGSGETKDNVKKDLNDNVKMATWASLMSEFIKKFFTVIRVPDENGNPNMTTVFMINPVRANIDPFSYEKFSQPGGFALKHAKAVDLHLIPGRQVKKGDMKVGKEINWKVSKGKHGISEGAEGTYRFLFNQGVDIVSDLVHTAKLVGTVKAARYSYVLGKDGVKLAEKIEGGIESVIEVVRAVPEIEDELREETLRRIREDG